MGNTPSKLQLAIEQFVIEILKCCHCICDVGQMHAHSSGITQSIFQRIQEEAVKKLHNKIIIFLQHPSEFGNPQIPVIPLPRLHIRVLYPFIALSQAVYSNAPTRIRLSSLLQKVVLTHDNPITTPPSHDLQAMFPVSLLPRVSPSHILHSVVPPLE